MYWIAVVSVLLMNGQTQTATVEPYASRPACLVAVRIITKAIYKTGQAKELITADCTQKEGEA